MLHVKKKDQSHNNHLINICEKMKKKEKCKLTIIRMVKTQNTESIKCCLGCGTAGTLAH